MNNKIYLLFLFVAPLLCLMAWTGSLYMQRSNGVDIKVAVTGYDPRDLLSGHYISYTIDWDKTDCSQFPDGVCRADEFCDGFFKERTFWGINRQCRFYVPEQYARSLDTLFRNRNNEDMVFEVIYSYSKGHKAIAKQLLINGKDWHDF